MGADGTARTLVARIAQQVMSACAPDWQRAQVYYRQVGRYHEHEAAAVDTGGRERELVVPDSATALFGQLRAIHPGPSDPWYRARLRLARPDRFALDTDSDEPVFRERGPEADDYRAEAALRQTNGALPAWLADILAGHDVQEQTRHALRALGAPESAVLFPAPGRPASVGSPEDARWEVSRNDGRWRARHGIRPIRHFGTAEDAAAYAIGHVALAQTAAIEEVLRAEHPIETLPGDPPLSLYRGLRPHVVQPGTLLDRLGGPAGNVTYLAGTPLPQRSLPEELLRQPRLVYRVTRPMEALFGEAIAWFGQPGGGTACVLPRAVQELIAVGALVGTDRGTS